MGGPNITPPYHKMTGGEVMDSNKSDSSSTSGTDSSPTHSHNGRNESGELSNLGTSNLIRLLWISSNDKTKQLMHILPNSASIST